MEQLVLHLDSLSGVQGLATLEALGAGCTTPSWGGLARRSSGGRHFFRGMFLFVVETTDAVPTLENMER